MQMEEEIVGLKKIVYKMQEVKRRRDSGTKQEIVYKKLDIEEDGGKTNEKY